MTQRRTRGGVAGGEGAGPEDAPRCAWCRRPFAATGGPGRPRKYCKRSCRQRDFEARRRARELGLTERDLIVTRGELDRLRDDLYVLESAIEDVERDLAESDDVATVRTALAWLLDAARPLVERDAPRSR